MYTQHLQRISQPDGTVRLLGRCRVTREEYLSPPVSPADLEAYERGELLAQIAFPDLSPEEREFLTSGTSPEGCRISPPRPSLADWAEEFEE